MKKFAMALPCHLNDDEVLELTDVMIGHLAEARRLKMAKKQSAADYKQNIEGREALAFQIESEITAKTKDKAVDCAEVKIEAANSVIVFRLDTGAEVSRRPMTDADNQKGLFEDQPASERDKANIEEERRIVNLFELHDLLKAAGVQLGKNLTLLWALEEKKIKEGRKWAAAKKVDPTADLPRPKWIDELEASSQKEVEEERAVDLRVNTIKAILLEQAIAISEDEIRAWSKDEQDQILAWTDSLMGEAPLPRPEFLEKYTQEGRAEAAESATSEATEESDGEIIDAEFHEVETASNGLGLSAEDLAAKINDLGAVVALDRVKEWSLKETQEAEAWIIDTQEAVNGNQERRPAPEFFFKN